MSDNIGLCNDKLGSKHDAINTWTQYDKETLCNIRRTVQNNLRLQKLNHDNIKKHSEKLVK